MGDFRLNIDMSVVGRDGKEHKYSMWLNWNEDRPKEVYNKLIELAQEAELEVNDERYLFDEYSK